MAASQNYKCTNPEMADMHLKYGIVHGNSKEARQLYQELCPNRVLPAHTTSFSSIHQRLRETGSFKPQKHESSLPEGNQGNTGDDVFGVAAQMQELCLTGEGSNIPTWLQNVESPFNWQPSRFSDVPSKEVIAKAKERIEMDEGYADTFPFEKFVRILTLVYEFSHQGPEGEEKAREQLALCDQLMIEERSKDEAMYDKLSGALTHAIQATRAHLLLRSGKIAEAREIAENIDPVSKMSENGQAAVQAVKARFFYHYRSQGARLAVQYAKEALRLAPDEPQWQVLTAEAIRRLRKFLPGMDEVSAEEVSLLESAVTKQRNARHLLLLAQVYRERGDSTFKQHRSERDFFQSQIFLNISDMQARAFELYKEALSLSPDYEVVNRLCGYGLLKLPAFKSDYRLAERCLQRALEQSPTNPTTIHSLGLYYYKGLMEYEKAALFCEKAGKLGNFPASLDMLRMKRLVYGNNYDPVFDFRRLLQQYGDDQTKRHEVLCQMGSYYLFFERNLSKALKYFRTLIKENAELSIITSHKCTFLNMARKINLFHCIVNEGLQLLQEDVESIKGGEDNSLNDIKTFLNELKVTNPEVFDVPVNTSLIDDLHKVSDDIKQTYIRKKERRDSCKEKRRNSFSRRSSLDDNLNFTRTQSDGNFNIRRRSAGYLSETLQNRIFRSPNTSSYKQQFVEGDPPQTFESNDKTLYKMEKPLNAQRRYDSFKSNGYYRDAGNTNFRRRSSGAIGSDMFESRTFKNAPQISESINENANEIQKTSVDSRQRKLIKSYSFQNGLTNGWNSRPHESYDGSTAIEKPNIENWRKRDDECY